MTWIEQYAEERSQRDPEFKVGYEEGAAILALVRARTEAKLTQKDVADALNVSQPYIAQIERGSKPMSLSLMFKYANVVGVAVDLRPQADKQSA